MGQGDADNVHDGDASVADQATWLITFADAETFSSFLSICTLEETNCSPMIWIYEGYVVV
jgi:hypothetical protein